MKTTTKSIILPEGTYRTSIMYFDHEDKSTIKDLVCLWSSLSNKLKAFGARAVNIPEGISEPLFCIAMLELKQEVVRITKSIPKVNTSFDCYNMLTHTRIQVKACSVLPDLTSFGPKSIFDKLAFMDLSQIATTGCFKIYDIDPKIVYNHKVNDLQTLKEQQLEGRRPRFKIYESIVLANNLQPIYIGDINAW